MFFLRGPPTTTSCTRSSERCAGSSSAWHSSFQLVSGFFKKNVKTSFSPVFVGKAMLCPASSFLRSAYFPLFIHLSSSSGLITAAPPLCRRGGDCEFFSVGSLTQNKRGGSRNLVHKQVSFLLRERHGIFFRFCASHAGYSHERSTRGPAQKLRNITKSLGYQKEPWRKAENPPQLNSAR